MTKSRTFRVAPRNMRFELIVALLVLAPYLTFTIMRFQFEDLSRHATAVFFAVLIPLVLGLTLWIHRRYVATGELVINDVGMGLKSEVPKWMGAAYQRPWTVRWNDIRRVTLLERMGIVRISRKGSLLPIALRITDWIPAGMPPELASAPAGFLRRRPDLRESELWKALDQRGIFAADRADATTEAVNFDLAKHPATRAALVVMGVLTAYCAIDVFTATEAWAEWRPLYLIPHHVIGAVGAVVAFALLRSAREPHPVPTRVALVLAVFAGLSVGLASWTGLVRVNQVFGGPLQAHDYVRNDACDTLEPLQPGLPPIEYTHQARAYWCQFPKDKHHSVLLRKGLGGLYQVDLSEHTRAIREFRARAG